MNYISKIQGIFEFSMNNKSSPQLNKRRVLLGSNPKRSGKISIYSIYSELLGYFNLPGGISALKSLRSGDLCSSGIRDKTLYIWSMREKCLKQRLIYRGKTNINYLHEVKRGALAGGAPNGQIIIWEYRARVAEEIVLECVHRTEIIGIIKLGENYMVSAEHSGLIVIWNLNNYTPHLRFRSSNSVNQICALSSGQLVCGYKSHLNIYANPLSEWLEGGSLYSHKGPNPKPIILFLEGYTHFASFHPISRNILFLAKEYNSPKLKLIDIKWKELFTVSIDTEINQVIRLGSNLFALILAQKYIVVMDPILKHSYIRIILPIDYHIGNITIFG